MGFSTVQNVREIGKLPGTEKLPDVMILPHLESACRVLRRWIGDYSSNTGDDYDACLEAECCIAMSLLIPVFNTFYTEGAPGMQKEIGNMDFLFHNPEQAKQVALYWEERARQAIKHLQTESSENQWFQYAAV